MHSGLQATRALPSQFFGQLHMAWWLTTLHSALVPHAQGLSHLKELTQAKWLGHSESLSHSWRQPVKGEPR